MTYNGLSASNGQFAIVDIGGGQLGLTFSAVPEPSALGILGLLGLGLAVRRRRHA